MSLRTTARALETLERFAPGLADELALHPLEELEAEGNPGIPLFKASGAPSALIPSGYGGGGATARDAVQMQLAMGSLAPSTAVGVSMHQFTVATLVEIAREGSGVESIVLEAVGSQGLLLASGFAEGRPDGKVLDPSTTVTEDGPGYRLSGSKKPCSLSQTMDMITVSVKLPGPDEEFAIALLEADAEGIRVEPFWTSPVLAGAETHTVVFDEVRVPHMALSLVAPSRDLDEAQLRGYAWFNLCVSAAYLGIAAGLVERLPDSRVDAAPAVAMASEIAGAVGSLDSVAARIDAGEKDAGLLADVLLVRYSVERAIHRATDLAFELLGVVELSKRPDMPMFFTASRALSYHPPSRRRAEPGLGRFLQGQELVLE